MAVSGESMRGADNSLELVLFVLAVSGAASYDPTGFRYLRALVNRQQRYQGAVAASLHRRIVARAQKLWGEYAAARRHAGQMLALVKSRFPEQVAAATALYASVQYKALERLVRRLGRPRREDVGAKLNSLAEVLSRSSRPSHSEEQSLTEQLREQDRLLHSAPQGVVPDREMPGGLRSAQYAARRQSRDRLETLVSEILAELPESPGPLNPQMLAIRSLKTLHGLSPHYLERFIRSAQLLLWLQQSMPAPKPGKGKRPAR